MCISDREQTNTHLLMPNPNFINVLISRPGTIWHLYFTLTTKQNILRWGRGRLKIGPSFELASWLEQGRFWTTHPLLPTLSAGLAVGGHILDKHLQRCSIYHQLLRTPPLRQQNLTLKRKLRISSSSFFPLRLLVVSNLRANLKTW